MKHLILLFLFLPILSFAQHMGTTTLEVKVLPKPTVLDEEVVNFLGQFPEEQKLSDGQREWFYWTNYSRKNPRRFWDSVVAPILAVYPKYRNAYTTSLQKELYNSRPLPMVKPNSNLAKTANELAADLAKHKSSPSHTSSTGATFQDRMNSISIRKCAGENISFGPGHTILMLMLLYVDEGVSDLGHRHTLLDSSFTEMGIGIGVYPDDKYTVVQDFACPQD